MDAKACTRIDWWMQMKPVRGSEPPGEPGMCWCESQPRLDPVVLQHVCLGKAGGIGCV